LSVSPIFFPRNQKFLNNQLATGDPRKLNIRCIQFLIDSVEISNSIVHKSLSLRILEFSLKNKIHAEP
jgi:hypothetical protein